MDVIGYAADMDHRRPDAKVDSSALRSEGKRIGTPFRVARVCERLECFDQFRRDFGFVRFVIFSLLWTEPSPGGYIQLWNCSSITARPPAASAEAVRVGLEIRGPCCCVSTTFFFLPL
jgi:hypothetical protein